MSSATPKEPLVDPASSGGDDLEQVRELLFGKEKTQLSHLQERLEDPQLRAQDVGRVLPEAVRFCTTASEDRLTRALTPSVESALRESVRRNPSILIHAIFPIIGPAIRRATSEAFGRLVQAVNEALEHSFSMRGLRWRWEAFRTGRSYAEIVILRSLVFRVERVLLIERPTGLLLQQVTLAEVSADGGDVVSGMLTAIQDFVRDSFRVGADEPLHTLQVGELSVWVEGGPRASLAAVIRGHASMQLRQQLQSTLERIHGDFGEVLTTERTMDEATAEGLRTAMEACLVRQVAAAGPRSLRKVWVLASVLVAVVGLWLFLQIRERSRWADYVQRLSAEEGLLVVHTERSQGRWRVVGLRDPLAVDPATLLGAFGFSTQTVASRWEAYEARSPGLVLRRAQRVLSPPDAVTLSFDGGILRAEGVAPRAWVAEARLRWENVGGVQAFDPSRVFDPAEAELSAALRKVEATVLYFEETVRLVAGQDSVLGSLVVDLRQLREAAERVGRRCQVTLVGHTDRKGTAEYNQRLGRQRAEEVRGWLEARGVPSGWLRTQGVGASQPARAEMRPAEETLNRRVTVRVVMEGEEPSVPAP